MGVSILSVKKEPCRHYIQALSDQYPPDHDLPGASGCSPEAVPVRMQDLFLSAGNIFLYWKKTVKKDAGIPARTVK